MPTVTLTLPEATPRPERVPGRLRLDLEDLLRLAHAAGDLPLPLHLPADEQVDASVLEQRLSGGAPTPAQEARARLAGHVARSDDAAVATRLREQGLLVPGDDGEDEVGAPVAGAIAVLAAPEVLVSLDLVVGREREERRLRSWFAVRGDEVAQLSTADALGYELGWFGAGQLWAALERAATVDGTHDDADDSSGDDASEDEIPVPDGTRIPYDLLLAGTEAVRRNRPDIVADLARRFEPQVELPDAGTTTAECLHALERECRGRLRVTTVRPGDRVAGVVSWTLLTDGWRWLEPCSDGPEPAVVLHRVEPRHLGRAVAPVLAQVVR